MPRYKKKITSLMDYTEFNQAIGSADLDDMQRAFLTLLFFCGCRVSEALILGASEVSCTQDMIYVQFYRLKGSKQTDPQEIPKAPALAWLCGHDGLLFPFSRSTAYRLVKRVFPALYPHYFRMNRITKVDEKFGDAVVYHVFGICAQSIDHYRGKVDVKRVGQSLKEELIRKNQ